MVGRIQTIEQQRNRIALTAGGILRELREEAGLTQEELARQLRISKALVGKSEQGRRQMTLAEWIQFENVLGLRRGEALIVLLDCLDVLYTKPEDF